MKKKYYLSHLVFFLLTFNLGFGQEIVSYSSMNDPITCSGIVNSDANLTAVGICRSSGITAIGGPNYNSRSWTTGITPDSNDYLEWTLTPNAGYQVDLTTMNIDYDRSTTGPSSVEIQVDIGSGFTTIHTNTGFPITPQTINGIDLSSITAITGTITFRLYGYNATSSNGTLDVEENTVPNKGIVINGTVTSTCLLTTTWDGTMWTPATPDNTYAVIIDADYSSATDGGSFDACSLTVNALNTLSIQGTDYVQVTNDVVIDGTILVASEASFVQVSDASTVTLNGAGIGTVQKTTTPLQDFYSYTYWSSPFTNETIESSLAGVPTDRIFDYNPTNFSDTNSDGFDDNSNDWGVATGAMTPGKGYAAIARSSAMTFPQTQSYTFDGQFNNGQITTSVDVSAAAGDPNWNLLGNPYPSGLNADQFLTDLANVPVLDGTIYLWTHNSAPLVANPGPDVLNFSVDDYATYNPGIGGVQATSGGVIPTNIIASGQGFFIEALNPGSATFNNSMRATAGNDNFYRATDRIWLNLENDYGAFSQILIGFVEGATSGVDRLYDGKRLDAASYISFFSLIDGNHYAVQGLDELTDEETVSLGIKNLVSGESEYKISIHEVEGLLESSEILLVDNLLNITHDLNSSEYVFNSNQGVFKERFELVLKFQSLSINDFSNTLEREELIITKTQDDYMSFATSSGVQIQSVKIFDVLGRELYNLDFTKKNETSFKLKELEQTIFIAKARLVNGKLLTKKSLR